MAQNTKISVRKVLQALFTFVVASACITAIISASKIENKKTIERVQVHIKSEKLYHFVEEKQILDEAINNRNIDIMNTSLAKLDIQSMEKVLMEDPWVADAQVYVDNNRVLHILITQRVPIARIFDKSGASYYIDNTLSVMPLSDNFKYYTSIVTNAPVIGNDSLGKGLKAQVAALVNHIRADTFWNAQVSQIIIDSDYTFQLMPVLGQQKIIFGDTSRMEEKFNNIRAFYMKVLNKIGWDKYETLDVRFHGQIVASPSLPFKGPVDKAIHEMNWINSIEQTEARKDSIEAVAKGKAPEAKKEPVKKPEPAPAKEKPRVAAAPAKPAPPKDKKEVKKEEKKDDKKPAKGNPAAKAPAPKKADGPKDKNDKKSTDKKPAKYIYPDNNN